jgi:hypothetical protein
MNTNPLIYPLPNIPMLGKGSLLIDRFDANGNPTSVYYPLGNVTKFEIEPKDDIAELYGSMNATSSLIASALKKRQIKITITGTDFKSDVIDIVAMGDGKNTVATSASTFTAEVLVPANALTHKGRYAQTKHRNVDFSGTPPVLTNNAVPLTAGTDYVLVDAEQGLIYFPAGTTAVDGDPTTITYHTLVGSQDEINGGVTSILKCALKFVPDPTDGQKWGVDVWAVNLSPSGQVGLISDDYANWNLDGLVLDSSVLHPTQPYYRMVALT